MKNLTYANFALSREEMKSIIGGQENYGECSVTCPSGGEINVTCTDCSAGKRNGIDCVWCNDSSGIEKCCLVA